MTPEQELLDTLREELGRGLVVIRDDPSPFEARIERFPFCGSQIDWAAVPGAVGRRVETADFDRYCDEVQRFVGEVVASRHLDLGEEIAIVSDNAMAGALTMELRTFLACLRRILALPQHTYVVGVNGGWCMVFAMEGYLDFGYAPEEGPKAPAGCR